MRLHDRYVLQLFLKALFFCIVGLVIVFFLVDLFEKIDDFIDHSARVRDVARFYAYKLPEMARLTLPVWIFEPAVELGARSVFGGAPELTGEIGGTARLEAAVRLGPVALGAGVVVLGYTGDGVDVVTLDPPSPPVYVVVRGALQ